MHVRAATPQERKWLIERVGCAATDDLRAIVAVDASGQIRGATAYDFWTATSVQCHMAAETPMAWRALLPAALEYPFLEADKRVLLAAIRSSNHKSLSVAKHIGFKECYRVKDGFDIGDDLCFMEMRRDDWLSDYRPLIRGSTLRETA